MIKTIIALLVIMMMAGTATAVVETGWPLDTPNTHSDPHVLVDLNEGSNSGDLVNCPVPGVTFVALNGHPWIYGCRDDRLNIYSTTNPNGHYIVNGWAGAYCGSSGNAGKVVFDDPVSHVSILASINTGLMMDAYNDTHVKVTTSGVAPSNGGTKTFARLSVDRTERDISYVIIHDSGNYWLIDDLLFTRGTVISIGDAFNNDTIPIMVRGAENVGSADVTLTYNSSIVTVTAVGNGDMDSMFSNLESAGDGWIRIGAYQTNNPGLDGEFILANVTFSPVGDGVCPLNITVTTFKDATVTGAPMEYTVNNGTYSSYYNGDVNGDGLVDMFDAMYIAKYSIEMSGFGTIIEQTADVDGNGIIDIHDASRLAKCIIGIPGWCPLE